MSLSVISVENLSKSHRLGQIGTGTLTNDLKVWWVKKHGLCSLVVILTLDVVLFKRVKVTFMDAV